MKIAMATLWTLLLTDTIEVQLAVWIHLSFKVFHTVLVVLTGILMLSSLLLTNLGMGRVFSEAALREARKAYRIGCEAQDIIRIIIYHLMHGCTSPISFEDVD